MTGTRIGIPITEEDGRSNPRLQEGIAKPGANRRHGSGIRQPQPGKRCLQTIDSSRDRV